jgi:hypothetical protein
MYKIRYVQWALAAERLRSYQDYLTDFNLQDDDELSYRKLDVSIKYKSLMEQDYCLIPMFEVCP